MFRRTWAESASAVCVEPRGFGSWRQLVLRHRERRQRGAWGLQRLRRDPRLERRLELLAEASPVEAHERRFPPRVRVHPRRERRHVDLLLGVRQVGGASRLDPGLVHAGRGFRLLAVPPGRLVAAPRSRDGREREQDGGADLDPVPLVRGGHETGTPRASQGKSTRASTACSDSSMIRSVLSIATGRTPPTPS